MSRLPTRIRRVPRILPLLALCSCHAAKEPGPLSPSASAPAAASAEAHGVDREGMDLSILPGVDFFSFANGAWLQQTQIPADRSSWGVAAELAQQTVLEQRELLEAAVAAAPSPGSEARKVADYYASFMDEA